MTKIGERGNRVCTLQFSDPKSNYMHMQACNAQHACMLYIKAA